MRDIISFTRIGRKKMFLRDLFGGMDQYDTVSVYEFYVNKHYRGTGKAKELMEYILKCQHRTARRLSYF